MFGAIVAGRLVQTNLQQIDETHFVFPLENPFDINHLTVFLLGTVPFPEGYGATVHFAWPGGEYFPLGTLTNARPSSIYKVRPHLPPGVSAGTASPPAQLGIEIAPLEQVEAMQAGIKPVQGKEVAARVDVGKVADKVVKNVSVRRNGERSRVRGKKGEVWYGGVGVRRSQHQQHRRPLLTSASCSTSSTALARARSRPTRRFRSRYSRGGMTTLSARLRMTAARRSLIARTKALAWAAEAGDDSDDDSDDGDDDDEGSEEGEVEGEVGGGWAGSPTGLWV